MKKKITRAINTPTETAAYVNVDSISNIIRWLRLLCCRGSAAWQCGKAPPGSALPEICTVIVEAAPRVLNEA